MSLNFIKSYANMGLAKRGIILYDAGGATAENQLDAVGLPHVSEQSALEETMPHRARRPSLELWVENHRKGSTANSVRKLPTAVHQHRGQIFMFADGSDDANGATSTGGEKTIYRLANVMLRVLAR
jgi:hypothetical protein